MSNLRKKININGSGTEIFTISERGQVDIYSPVPAGTNTIGNVKNVNGSDTEIFTETNPAIVSFKTPQTDGFGRLRTSQATGLFDCQFQYNTQTAFLWNESISGAGASVTHLPNESSVQITVGTVSGEKVIRQTKRYIRYQPGKSQFVALTGVLGAKKASVRQRVGLFDDNNGLFFEQDENNLKVVRRTYVSGSPTDNAVNQSSWNLDTLDGNGPSGITLDMTKTHIFIIDFQWLGVGRVRLGFDIDGDIIYCHEFNNANNLTAVYMTTANLPIRYELENTDTAASSTNMIQICTSVSSESGFQDERGITHAVSNGITTIGVTTRRPILSVRPKATFNSITNHAEILPISFGLYATTNAAYYEIVLNGSLTGASFTSAGDNSLVEYDVSATAISGGDVIEANFIAAAANLRERLEGLISSKLALTNNIAGTSTDILSIVCTSFTGTSNLSGEITVKEIY